MNEHTNNFSPVIEAALKQLNFDGLKPMQQEMLDCIEPADDIVLLAPTGSGKTLGFLFPILTRLTNIQSTQALIIAPSRELALQIEQVFKSLKTPFKVNCCYGGHSVKTELNNLLDAPHVLIGTPGRIADHFRRESIDPTTISTLVLDEFDKSLELGFEDDIKFITNETRYVRKQILVSATDLKELPDYLNISDPTYVKSEGEKQNQGELSSYLLQASNDDKLEVLKDLIFKVGNEPTIIFCNHREAVERIGELLKSNHIPVGIFHGALKQEHRERELIKLRNKSSNILIATDLAARGIDIEAIKNIVHYQLPPKKDAYIHRNGRTARMEAAGNSFIILKLGEELPDFVDASIPKFNLAQQPDANLSTQYTTFYMGLGRKDKINKVDIVGLFYKKGGLKGNELGKIEVLDYCAFIAVQTNKVGMIKRNLQNEKIKKQKLILSVAR